MEIIDLYNKEKQKLNKTFKRGKDKLNKDEYYLLEQITKKQDEVTNIKYVSIQKFKEMQNNNELSPNLEYFIEIYKKL